MQKKKKSTNNYIIVYSQITLSAIGLLQFFPGGNQTLMQITADHLKLPRLLGFLFCFDFCFI
jgi:hypothetical protein